MLVQGHCLHTKQLSWSCTDFATTFLPVFIAILKTTWFLHLFIFWCPMFPFLSILPFPNSWASVYWEVLSENCISVRNIKWPVRCFDVKSFHLTDFNWFLRTSVHPYCTLPGLILLTFHVFWTWSSGCLYAEHCISDPYMLYLPADNYANKTSNVLSSSFPETKCWERANIVIAIFLHRQKICFHFSPHQLYKFSTKMYNFPIRMYNIPIKINNPKFLHMREFSPQTLSDKYQIWDRVNLLFILSYFQLSIFFEVWYNFRRKSHVLCFYYKTLCYTIWVAKNASDLRLNFVLFLEQGPTFQLRLGWVGLQFIDACLATRDCFLVSRCRNFKGEICRWQMLRSSMQLMI